MCAHLIGGATENYQALVWRVDAVSQHFRAQIAKIELLLY
jgi:hypothetical protein